MYYSENYPNKNFQVHVRKQLMSLLQGEFRKYDSVVVNTVNDEIFF